MTHFAKEHVMSLGETFTVYARRGISDSFIIRGSLHGDPYYNLFKIRGKTNIEELFVAIVTLLRENRSLQPIIDLNLNNLLDGITPSTKTIYSFGTKQAIYVDTDCRADFVSLEQPQIALVNLEEQKFYTSVYLSLSSVVKLLRYMTDRFHLYPVKETAV